LRDGLTFWERKKPYLCEACRNTHSEEWWANEVEEWRRANMSHDEWLDYIDPEGAEARRKEQLRLWHPQMSPEAQKEIRKKLEEQVYKDTGIKLKL